MNVDDSVSGHHVVELRCDVISGSSLEVQGCLVEIEVVRRVIGWWWLNYGWEWCWFGVWVGSVDVGVGFAMSCCVGGADADFVGGSSVMISIGVSWVSG